MNILTYSEFSLVASLYADAKIVNKFKKVNLFINEKQNKVSNYYLKTIVAEQQLQLKREIAFALQCA